MNYSDKLKSPKWQKRRLQILERDEFKCKICKCKEQTLHVHHINYTSNTDPWDYPDNKLITLCDVCHKKVHTKKDLILVSNSDISLYDFIQEYPNALLTFNKIEFHKGDWFVEFNFNEHSCFFDCLLSISKFKLFIRDSCDNVIIEEFYMRNFSDDCETRNITYGYISDYIK